MADDFVSQVAERKKQRLEAERTFEFLGETLTFKASILAGEHLKLEEARYRMLVEQAELQVTVREINGEEVSPELLRLMKTQTNDGDLLQIADESILGCLEPGSHDAWFRVRNDPIYPLPIIDIIGFADYLIGKVTGIPTGAPVDSSNGRATTGKQSKGSSSSKANDPQG